MTSSLPHGVETRDGAHALRSVRLLLLLFVLSSAPLAAQIVDTVDLLGSPVCRVLDEGRNGLFVNVQPVGTPASVIRIRLRMGGTATNGRDYRQNDTILVLEPGEVGTFLIIPFIDDDIAEAIETMEMRLIVIDGPGRIADTTPLRLYMLDNDSPSLNLLADPGFERTPTRWTIDIVGASTASDEMNGGARSLRLVASDSVVRRARQDVVVAPGVLYLYDINRKVSGVTARGPSAELIWFDAAGAEIVRETLWSLFGPTSPSAWENTSGCAVAPEGAVVARVLLSLPVEEDDTGTIWYDDISLIPMGEASDVLRGSLEDVRLDLSMAR
jgi:hypothetical protein